MLTKNGRATGVVLTDGTEFQADIVVSALDPRRTFLDLVEPRELPDDLTENGAAHEVPGRVVQGELRPERDPGLSGPARRRDRSVPRLPEYAPSMDYLEHAFDAAKYGWYSVEPYIDGAIQSTSTRTWRRPAST